MMISSWRHEFYISWMRTKIHYSTLKIVTMMYHSREFLSIKIENFLFDFDLFLLLFLYFYIWFVQKAMLGIFLYCSILIFAHLFRASICFQVAPPLFRFSNSSQVLIYTYYLCRFGTPKDWYFHSLKTFAAFQIIFFEPSITFWYFQEDAKKSCLIYSDFDLTASESTILYLYI